MSHASGQKKLTKKVFNIIIVGICSTASSHYSAGCFKLSHFHRPVCSGRCSSIELDSSGKT